MDWTQKKVLITGAGGFIGSHLTERLVNLGAQVRAFVHYNSLGRRGWLDNSPMGEQIEFIAGDITDRDSVMGAVTGVDIIFHLAALIGIPYSYSAPSSYIQTNISGTHNVLRAALDEGVDRVIHTSTSEVYGTAQYVPIDEQHPLQGQSPYSATKIAADKLAEAYNCSFELPVITIRPFNVYGPRQSARAVIPTIITQCMAGDSICLGNLKSIRDFTYVKDTIEGFILAAGNSHAIGEVINIGSGSEITIGDLAKKISGLMGKKIKIIDDRQRIRPEKSEVNRLWASNEQAEKLLDWKPSYSLDAGLRLTIKWIEEHYASYRPESYAI